MLGVVSCVVVCGAVAIGVRKWRAGTNSDLGNCKSGGHRGYYHRLVRGEGICLEVNVWECAAEPVGEGGSRYTTFVINDRPYRIVALQIVSGIRASSLRFRPHRRRATNGPQ